jgi:hypothetical protein
MKKIKFIVDFAWNEKVSSTMSIILIMLMSLVVAKYALSAADKVITAAPNSPIFNIEKR